MITNREEVLENALRVFAKMNYEKASLVTIAKACGLSKWGLIYYYSFKQDLFVAGWTNTSSPRKTLPTSSASGAARCWSSSTTTWRAWKRPCGASWACSTTGTTRRDAATTSTTSTC